MNIQADLNDEFLKHTTESAISEICDTVVEVGFEPVPELFQARMVDILIKSYHEFQGASFKHDDGTDIVVRERTINSIYEVTLEHSVSVDLSKTRNDKILEILRLGIEAAINGAYKHFYEFQVNIAKRAIERKDKEKGQ